MSNSTIKASGKMDKGIIQTPGGCFRIREKKPITQQKNIVCKKNDGPKRADSYDYIFDKMPI